MSWLAGAGDDLPRGAAGIVVRGGGEYVAGSFVSIQTVALSGAVPATLCLTEYPCGASLYGEGGRRGAH